jgi:hypothetical protein
MKTVLRIGVTGGRNYTDHKLVWRILHNQKLLSEAVGCKMFLVVGDATGADEFAREWATEILPKNDWKMFEADWNRWGNSAGPRRNRDMLISGIDKLCAFPGGKGTEDMVKICQNTGVLVARYE